MKLWKPIKGFNGRYHVSSDGEVMSSARKNVKILAERRNPDGYVFVALTERPGTKTKYRAVHRLVCEAFLRGEGEVNHKNGIKTDNRLENLEWCTRTENIRHRTRTGLWKYKVPLERFNEVRERYRNGESQRKIAQSFNCSHSQIGLIIRRKTAAWYA